MVRTKLQPDQKAHDLDNYDLKILYELDKDGRTPIQKIATVVKKSKKFVRDRLIRMKEKGILIDMVTTLDTSKLGYQTYALYFQLINPTKREEVVEYLHQRREVWGINRLIGKYQLYITIYVKNTKEVEIFVTDFVKNFSEICGNYRLLLLYNGYSLAHNYLFPGFDLIHHDILRYGSSNVNLSEQELKMISLLSRNSRISLTQIAKEIHATKHKTRDIFADLTKREIFLFIRPSIDSTKLGYFPKHVLIKLKFNAMNKIETIIDYFLGLRCTKSVSLTFGNYHILGSFVFRNVHEFQQFEEQIWNEFSALVKEIQIDDYCEDVPFTPANVGWEIEEMD